MEGIKIGLWRFNHGYLPTKRFFRRLEIKVDVFLNTFEAQEVKVVRNITFKMMKLFTLVSLKQIDLSLFFVDGKNRKRIIPTFKMYDIDCCTVLGFQVFFLCVCVISRESETTLPWLLLSSSFLFWIKELKTFHRSSIINVGLQADFTLEVGRDNDRK